MWCTWFVKPCMTVIISIYNIDFGVGTKSGSKINKEVTFLSISLPVRLTQLVSLLYVCYSNLLVNVSIFHLSIVKTFFSNDIYSFGIQHLLMYQ